jgi:hypothetical protein
MFPSVSMRHGPVPLVAHGQRERRVTFATLLADAAVPVKAAQELMQHSSLELTLGLYVSPVG